MQADDTGSLRPAKGFLTSKLPLLEELSRPGMPEYTIEEFDPLIDSSDVNYETWATICRQIEKHYWDYDGFVVIHGTDTMAYTASAMSFMLENLGKPVVLTGSLLPFGSIHTDARRNLVVSVLIAGTSGIPEVCIFFNDRLMRGNRAVKVHAGGIAAFDSPNFPSLATLGADIRFNEHVLLPAPKAKFTVRTKLDRNILVLRLVPGFMDVENLGTSDLKGVVLLLYGTGNAPARKTALLDWVKDMVAKKVTVVACSQCLKGTVDLEKYAVGKALFEAGVVSAGDMTCEAAVTKLSYLLGRGLSSKQTRIAFSRSIAGEMSDMETGWSRL